MNKITFIFNILKNILIWFLFFLPMKLLFPSLYNLLFQNKHYKLKENITESDDKEIQDKWLSFIEQHNVPLEYQNDCIETLEYFTKFDKNITFDAQKEHPQFKNIQYIFHIISLAKEAIHHLEEITAEDKKIAYYESNNNASLDTLIEHYIKKLNAKNEDKLLTKFAKNEVRLRKFIVKLKKHDPLFINFYLMLYIIFPMSNFMTKEKDKEDLEIFQDLFEFFRIGHATKSQIHKSVAIQLYYLYKDNISKVDIPSNTTEEELKNQIGKLIDFTFQTEKAYKNFNNIDQEPYVKNIIYNFPLFECDKKLSEKQVRRFKFYFIGKNNLVPRYIPKIIRKLFLNKMVKTPLSYYHTTVSTTLFGLFQRKI